MAKKRHGDDVCEVWEGDAREVAAGLEAGSCSLAILDGPFSMGKAAWDRQGIDGLADWYRPHLEDVDRVCAASASLYVWNTAEGWARLDPLIRSMGWTFRALVVWDKGIQSLAGKGLAGVRTWPSVSEFLGFYQREAWAPATCAGADERNWVRVWLRSEWFGAGLRAGDADTACGVKQQASRHYFPADQWALPTWEAYQTLAAYAAEHGTPRDRPYLVHPDHWPAGGLRATYDHLRAEYDHLRAEYDHLRAEYEASRPAFVCPLGVGNVWAHPPVTGAERLRDESGRTLHPCQKPVAFARRMVEASTRPGERVWVPFGGTLRECIAARDIARDDPEAARYVIAAELNQDGPDYIGAALRQYSGQGVKRVDPRQGVLW